MKNNILCDIEQYLPEPVAKCLGETDSEYISGLCEVRITLGRPIVADFFGRLEFLKNFSDGSIITADRMSIKKVVDTVTRGSMYSVNETIKRGFVTVRGGHRIGFCGTAVSGEGGVRHIKDISSVCIRISRSVKASAAKIKDELCTKKRVYNVLIASPPGCGKTTVLRDACRMLADGELPCGMQKVGIADERSEIAAVYEAVPQHDVGCCSFVCDGYNKAEAMQMMLRSMSPNVIATDEIGSEADFAAVRTALKSGVSVIATAHADTIDDLCFKYGAQNIRQCFEKIVFLRAKGVTGKIYRRDNNDY